MLPDLHLLSTEHLKKLLAVQQSEYTVAANEEVSADELETFERTMEQLSIELQGRG